MTKMVLRLLAEKFSISLVSLLQNPGLIAGFLSLSYHYGAGFRQFTVCLLISVCGRGVLSSSPWLAPDGSFTFKGLLGKERRLQLRDRDKRQVKHFYWVDLLVCF